MTNYNYFLINQFLHPNSFYILDDHLIRHFSTIYSWHVVFTNRSIESIIIPYVLVYIKYFIAWHWILSKLTLMSFVLSSKYNYYNWNYYKSNNIESINSRKCNFDVSDILSIGLDNISIDIKVINNVWKLNLWLRF